ncbi:MAG: hypothetical protein GXO65_02085, partial [Euryarchaeota archaeon]|nr:hypothetical protein [Euryarchaeota archaeon]
LEWIIAQAYSHKSGTPIVTTDPDFLTEDAKVQLQGYLNAGARKVLVLGGEKAVSPAVERELAAMGFLTHRISEGDRHGTSARVAMELYPGVDSCVIVNGESYSGLLVAERAAALTGSPILLVKSDEVPGSVQEALVVLGIRDIYLVTEGLSEDVGEALSSSGYRVHLLRNRSDIPAQGGGLPDALLPGAAGAILGVLAVLGWSALKRSRERVPFTLLTEDEEKVVRAIRERGGELTQDLLPEMTGFSRPKISRIVADLADRQILSKTPQGRTQKLRIEKEFYEK